MRVLYVCTGNLNRSVAAEAISSMVAPHVMADSAGLSSNPRHVWGGRPPTLLRAALSDAGVPYDPGHQARPVQDGDLAGADIIAVMTPRHAERLVNVAPKVRGLWTYVDVPVIPDPAFDSSGASHREVVRLLLVAVPKLLEAIHAHL